MPSFYRINVSQHGRFYFRTDSDQNCTAVEEQMVADFRMRFPATEGFKVELTYWECSGKTVEVR